MSSSEPRTRAQERARRRKQKQNMSMGMIFVGVALVIVSILSLIQGRTPAQASVEIDPEDIVYGQTLTAIHEMSGPTLSSIPFLPRDEAQPKVAVSEAFFDFGGVGATEVVKHEFYIQNVGDAPLTISRAYTTCACTTAEFSATVIPPGKFAIMTLIFDAGYHDVRGQSVRRGVMIENNDPDMPQLEIWTQANIGNN